MRLIIFPHDGSDPHDCEGESFNECMQKVMYVLEHELSFDLFQYSKGKLVGHLVPRITFHRLNEEEFRTLNEDELSEQEENEELERELRKDHPA